MIRFANSAYWTGTYTAASQGLWPKQHEITEGTHLYRFIDLNKGPSASGADGPWWFEYDHFQTIKHFAQRNNYPLGYAARMFAAILYEWSDVNAVVRAKVVHGPLLAWKGKGKQVEAKQNDPRDVASLHGIVTARSPALARKMTPMQGSLEVLQLFVAGLGRPHNKFSSFMKIESTERITTA